MRSPAWLARAGRAGAVVGSVIALTACAKDPEQPPSEQISEAKQAAFTNGDFENGPANAAPLSWTLTPYFNPGVTIQSPQTRAGLNLAAGGSLQTISLYTAAGSESQPDTALGSGASLRWPKYGNYVAYINTNGTGANVNSLKQSMTLGVADVDPADGKTHIRFAVAPVLENPGHSADSQPYYFVQLTNTTRGVILYRDYNASAQPGVPWKISNGVYYTDWQLVDIAPTSAQAALGDSVELEVIAAGCSAGGHYGRVYVDGVGALVPGLFVSGTGPASANAGSDVTYTLNYKNGGNGGAANVVVAFNTPPNTVYRSVNAPGATCSAPAQNATGTLSCALGSLPAGAGGSLQVTVRINSGTTGTITAGDYAVSATAVSPLIGPKVYTSVTQNVTYADLAITVSNGVAGVAWGTPTTYTIVATNSGPNAVTGATVTDAMPAQLTGVSWICAGSNGGTCAASGSGSINDATVGLPVGASVTYTVNGTVVSGSGAGSLANTASIALPAGASDPDPANNAAGDTDPIGSLYTVSLTKSGNGSVTSVPAAISCGLACTSASGSFLQGSTVILSATPAPGDTFLGWSGACSGTGTCTFNLAGNTSVSAAFSTPLASNGASCAAGSECQSGSCVDGVCCDTACGGGAPSDCQACNLAGSVGTCTPIAAGTVCRASAGVCDVAETCDGASAACPADGFQPPSTECRASAGPCDVAESCTGSAAACPADGFQPSSTECRPAADVCDVAESCTGSAAACPADGFQPSSTVCRASAGICDVAESCTGSAAACPADGFQPSSTECRASAGICDVAESCTGSAAACPADGFQPSSTVCRASAGICDVAESCTGSAAACPADGFQPSSTVCRASAGICDVAESCTGSAAACPADGFQPSSTECRASAGICDVAESCTGSAAACPADGFQPSSTVCRASAGICDVAESCTGSAAACPADGFQPSSTVCRASAGICDVAESCTGSAAACPADGFQPSSTVCRASAGICDVAESCTGSAAACPADGFQPSSTVCRASAGICDVAESCTGSAAACPADGFQPSSTVCRASAGICDVAESCTGSAAACPADGFQPSSSVCRPAADLCDVAESCTGAGVDCPADGFASAQQACRPSAGPCDVVESCTGLGPACPTDLFAPASLICRASAGICDVAEACTGSAAACPADGFQPSSIVCRASAGICDVAESCTGAAAACPADGFQPSSTVCRASAGICDVAESCSGSAAACPADGFEPSSTVCRASAGVCDVAESCTGFTAACPGDGFAPPTQICQAASCASGVESQATACTGAAADCPAPVTVSCGGFICGASACLVTCAGDADCVFGHFCDAGTCAPKTAQGGACTVDTGCQSGFCVDGVCCDTACDGQCEACDVDGQVGTCAGVVGAPHGQRPACASDGSACGGSCDGAERTACIYPSGVICREASCSASVATIPAACDGLGACPALEVQPCAPFLCGASACAGDCSVDGDCQAGHYCSAGVCVEKRAPGAACSAKNQCGTGLCVDGVCCDSACNGQCEACDVAGSEGVCTPVSGAPHGKRPACASDGSLCGGTCDGVSPTLCAYPDASIICRDGSCVDGVATLEAGCNGVGACPAVQLQECGTFACGSKLCLADCTVDGDCQEGSYCSAGVCVVKQEPGAACSGANQCASGFCVDGVCCDTACTGQCAACDVEGKAGTCSPVLGAPHGAREACKGAAGTTCAGQCDGSEPSACAYPAAETTCRAAACEGGVATLAAACDGDGACPELQQQACGEYACGSDACAGDCTEDAHCSEGHFCAGGVCQLKRLMGVSCGGAGECSSGRCVDGVCCETACDGQCEACDVAGSEGVCAPVTGAPHGGRGACAGQGTCAGACDGTKVDGCVFPGATTTCADASCADGVATAASSCDGAGTCVTAEQQSCGSYACAESACATSCTSGAECAEGYLCTAGECQALPGEQGCSCATPGRADDRWAPVVAGLVALLLARRRRRD